MTEQLELEPTGLDRNELGESPKPKLLDPKPVVHKLAVAKPAAAKPEHEELPARQSAASCATLRHSQS
jgi:hypothetical protein